MALMAPLGEAFPINARSSAGRYRTGVFSRNSTTLAARSIAASAVILAVAVAVVAGAEGAAALAAPGIGEAGLLGR
jgi:hypothetical protein